MPLKAVRNLSVRHTIYEIYEIYEIYTRCKKWKIKTYHVPRGLARDKPSLASLCRPTLAPHTGQTRSQSQPQSQTPASQSLLPLWCLSLAQQQQQQRIRRRCHPRTLWVALWAAALALALALATAVPVSRGVPLSHTITHLPNFLCVQKFSVYFTLLCTFFYLSFVFCFVRYIP